MKTPKNRLINFLKLGIFLLGISLLLVNCEKEDINETESKVAKSILQVPTTDNEKIIFLAEGLMPKIKEYNRKYRTRNLFLKKYGGLNGQNSVTIKLLERSDEFIIVIPFKKEKSEHKKVLVAYYKNGIRNYKFFKNKIYNIEKDDSTPFFLEDLNLLFKLAYKSNSNEFSKSYCDYTYESEDYENCTITFCSPCYGCNVISNLGKDETCGGELDWVELDGDSGDEDDDWDWNDDDGNNNDDDDDWSDNDDDDNDDDWDWNDNNDSSNDEVVNELTGKERCIYDHLNNIDDSYLENLLSDFVGESEFDVVYTSKEHVYLTDENGVTTEVNGKTVFNENTNNQILIEINSFEMASKKALQVARTIMHETIHAEMARILNTQNPTAEDLDFRTTYEAYENGEFEASSQHETMAELYVNQMTTALINFHENVLVGDYNYLTNNGANPLPNAFYEALAWQGLKEQNVQAYTNLSQARKDELNNSLSTHLPSTTATCPE